MSDEQYIADDSDLRKYRTEIPNMADDELGVYEYRLYGHYKRVGTCFESVRTTAKKTHMSVGQVVDIRNKLVADGWIKLSDDPRGTIRITIVDRWAENFSRYSKRSQSEQAVHDMNSKRSPYEPKNKPIKNQPKEEPSSSWAYLTESGD